MNSDDDKLIRRMNDLKQVFRGDWSGAVLILLRCGNKQYRQLRDEMRAWSFEDPWLRKRRSLSNTELARTLKRMVEDRWQVRTETPTRWKPEVWYELSDAAQQALVAVAPLLSWAGENAEFFARAQAMRSAGRRGQGVIAARPRRSSTLLS